MKKFLVVLAVVLVAAAAAAAMFLRSKVPDLGPAGPNRELTPASVSIYVEAADLGGAWTKMQATDAWKDLAASKLAERALAADTVKSFRAALDQVAAKAGYPIDSTSVMKFLGRECSVGAQLDPQGGPAQIVVLAKLDVDALTKDFLGGKLDLEALQQEFERRTGQCDFAITRAPYQGHQIAAAVKGSQSFYGSLLGDTLVVATSDALVRGAIDCRLARGAGSLGRLPTFTADVAALKPGANVVSWFDLDALEARRASFERGLASLGVPSEGVASAGAVLAGTRGAHSVALAAFVPEGDLYRVSWTWSKTRELFADQGAPALRELFYGDWLAFTQMSGAGKLGESWKRSALRRNLGKGAAQEWLDALVEDPAAKIAELMPTPPGGLPEPDDELDSATANEDPAARAAHAARDLLDRFAARMGRHLASEELDALVAGEAAAAADWTGEPGATPRFAGALRLDTEGRLLVLAAQAAIDARETSVTSEDVGTRKVFTWTAEHAVHWTLVGDALVVSNDADFVRQAARSVAGKALGPSPGIRDTVAAFKDGWTGFAFVDFDRLTQAVTASTRGNPSGDQMRKILDIYADLGTVGTRFGAALYVAEDLGSLEVKTRTWLSEPKSAEGREIRASMTDREPVCWKSLPATTILHSVSPSCGVRTMWYAFKAGFATAGGDMKAMESSFRETMGMDLEKEVIPAFGNEISFAITYRAAEERRAAPPGQTRITLPGFLLGIEVKDTATIRTLIDNAIRFADDRMRDRGRPDTASPFSREGRDGVEIVRLNLPPEAQGPVDLAPALALHDGYLFVSTDLDCLHAAVDAKNGKGKRLADTPAFGHATTALGRASAGFFLLDWPLLCDEIAVFSPELGGSVAARNIEFPEYPDDGDAQEWQRRLDAYEKKRAEAKTSGGTTARKWIDAMRVVEFVAVGTHAAASTSDTTFVVKFSD